MVHDLPADMLYLRHVYLMALGICTLTNHMSVDVYARSAGTHTALALAAHLPELNREWGHLLSPPRGKDVGTLRLSSPTRPWASVVPDPRVAAIQSGALRRSRAGRLLDSWKPSQR